MSENHKPIRKVSEEYAQNLLLEGALQAYEEAGRPYGSHTADLKRWFMEGGYEEWCAEQRGDL